MSSGTKRDHAGNARPAKGKPVATGGRFQDMFAGFRDELDEHHDRRERIIKASRDVTAQSKKMSVPINEFLEYNVQRLTPFTAFSHYKGAVHEAIE